MPPITLKGHALKGHGCFGGHNIAMGDNTFLVNNIEASYKGASSTVHCCGPACHSGSMSGNNTFIINDKSAQKITDSVSCGSQQIQGDGTFIID